MSEARYVNKKYQSLAGKRVAVTGSTGGLGRELCRYLASLGAELCLVDRNRERSEAHRGELIREYPNVEVRLISADLEDMESVRGACRELGEMGIDILIHNAGAYSIPRHKTASGLDNVFQINCAAPYYMTKALLPALSERGGRVVCVGSIAHNYSRTREDDIDFSGVRSDAKTYGNAKRRLMFSLYELFERGDAGNATLAVCHPGITFTNITAHYPKVIFAIIKHPMKIIFMKPKKAALSILEGVFEPTEYHTWIGPRLFGIWGLPKKKKLKTCMPEESRRIFEEMEKIVGEMV